MIPTAFSMSSTTPDDSDSFVTGLVAPWPIHAKLPPCVSVGIFVAKGTYRSPGTRPSSDAERAIATKASASGLTATSGPAHVVSVVEPGAVAALVESSSALRTVVALKARGNFRRNTSHALEGRFVSAKHDSQRA